MEKSVIKHCLSTPLWVLLALACTACQTTEKSVRQDNSDSTSSNSVDINGAIQRGIGSVFGGVGEARQQAGGKFKETGLYGLYKGKEDPDLGWPRLAITIHKLPSRAYERQIGTPSDYQTMCMNYSAVLWTSEKSKKEIKEQDFCYRDIDRKWKPTESAFWINWVSYIKRVKGNTGLKRTDGPNPPDTSFPRGNQYIDFTQSRGSYILNGMFAMMDFDPAIIGSKEHRVWIVSLPSEVDLSDGKPNVFKYDPKRKY